MGSKAKLVGLCTVVLAACFGPIPEATGRARRKAKPWPAEALRWEKHLRSFYGKTAKVKAWLNHWRSANKAWPACHARPPRGVHPLRLERWRLHLQVRPKGRPSYATFTITIAKLRKGSDGYQSYRQLEKHNRKIPLSATCMTSKAPQMLAQVGPYWIEFVARCAFRYRLKTRADGFLDSLRKSPWKAKLPKEVIFSPCGVMTVHFVRVSALKTLRTAAGCGVKLP